MNLVKFCNKYDGIVINGIQTMRFFLPLFVDSGKTVVDEGRGRGPYMDKTRYRQSRTGPAPADRAGNRPGFWCGRKRRGRARQKKPTTARRLHGPTGHIATPEDSKKTKPGGKTRLQNIEERRSLILRTFCDFLRCLCQRKRI